MRKLYSLQKLAAVHQELKADYGSAVNAVIIYTAGAKVDGARPFALVMQ